MIHVVPTNEQFLHEPDTTCSCEARVEFGHAEILVIHTAFNPEYSGPWSVEETD